MIEVNRETASIMNAGLELIAKFSKVDKNTRLNLRRLSLARYDNPENWLLVLMRMLFINSSTEISHEYLTDINDIVLALENTDEVDCGSCYEFHMLNFLTEYGYYSCDEETENSDEYLEDYLDYFTSLNLKELKFHTPLLSESNFNEVIGFVKQIPYLIGPIYGLSRKDLLSCEVKKDKDGLDVVSVYYFTDDYGDFYLDIDKSETYSEFMKVVELHNSTIDKGKEVQ